MNRNTTNVPMEGPRATALDAPVEPTLMARLRQIHSRLCRVNETLETVRGKLLSEPKDGQEGGSKGTNQPTVDDWLGDLESAAQYAFDHANFIAQQVGE